MGSAGGHKAASRCGGALGLRSLCIAGLLMAMAGCATAPSTPEQATGRYNIGQRLLQPESDGGTGGGIEPYTLAASETFRMPEPLRAPLPALPEGYDRQSLPPTTVCVRVMLATDGSVQRTESLLGPAECEAGRQPQHVALLQAAVETTSQWTFQPAAICRFAPGMQAASFGDCTGAAQVEAVPVTLLYAFTFAVEQGKVTVRSRDGPR
ncbi:MAG: hypothetical protein ACOH1V_11440 [Stenotrophomonas sp.]